MSAADRLGGKHDGEWLRRAAVCRYRSLKAISSRLMGETHRVFAGSSIASWPCASLDRWRGTRECMGVEQEPHSMYSRISSSGSLKSSGTTSRPSYWPAFGTPVTGGEAGVDFRTKGAER